MATWNSFYAFGTSSISESDYCDQLERLHGCHSTKVQKAITVATFTAMKFKANEIGKGVE